MKNTKSMLTVMVRFYGPSQGRTWIKDTQDSTGWSHAKVIREAVGATAALLAGNDKPLDFLRWGIARQARLQEIARQATKAAAALPKAPPQ